MRQIFCSSFLFLKIKFRNLFLKIKHRWMLIIGLTTLLIAIPLYSSSATPTVDRPITAIHLTRIRSLILLLRAALSFNRVYALCVEVSPRSDLYQVIGPGLGLYSGLFQVSTLTLFIETFIFVVGAIILLPWMPVSSVSSSSTSSIIPEAEKRMEHSLYPLPNGDGITVTLEYSLIVVFTTIGASFLVSSRDLVTMYLSIELQSFAVYILAAIYRNSESATSAGLKYFLLGAMSSALILLGSRILYAYTGLTNFEGIAMLANVQIETNRGLDFTIENQNIDNAIVLGWLIISIGFLFKVAAAPFHNWAPDVYDGVPTIVTTWLTVMPKISIFIFLLGLTTGLSHVVETGSLSIILKSLLLATAFLSLIIGTVVGLAQNRIKRLLAYSTISHVGFMLLALSVSSEESIRGFLFYLIQYSLTNLNAFFVILAFGYFTSGKDIRFISDLKGQFLANPMLSLSLALCLFSMAGIPPLAGFFAKYLVLYSAIENGYYFLSITGILASVVSAVYYLRIIRVLYFEDNLKTINSQNQGEVRQKVRGSVHSYTIAALTFFILFFILTPSLFLNSCNLLALSFFTA